MAFIKPIISIQKKEAQRLSFCISIPKKELKKAVDRNKLKRRIRVIMASFPKKPLLVKIFVRKQALYVSYSELHDIIKTQYD